MFTIVIECEWTEIKKKLKWGKQSVLLINVLKKLYIIKISDVIYTWVDLIRSCKVRSYFIGTAILEFRNFTTCYKRLVSLIRGVTISESVPIKQLMKMYLKTQMNPSRCFENE